MRAVNLIPAEQRGGGRPPARTLPGRRVRRRRRARGPGALLFLYGRAEHQVPATRRSAAQLTAQAAAAQAKVGQLAPYASFIALREQREQAVAELAGTRFNWAHVLHEFGRVLPAGTSISALSGTVGSASSATSSSSSGKAASGGSVASSTPAGSVPSFTLSGCATSQRKVALDARAPAPDRRRQRSHACELDGGHSDRRGRLGVRRLPGQRGPVQR